MSKLKKLNFIVFCHPHLDATKCEFHPHLIVLTPNLLIIVVDCIDDINSSLSPLLCGRLVLSYWARHMSSLRQQNKAEAVDQCQSS